MTREEGMALVHELLKNKNLVKHCLAVEACMRELARHFGEDEDLWGLAGLMHDADYEATEKDPAQHTLLMAKLLEERNCDPRIIHAVRAHSDEHGVPRESLMDKALYACDNLSGLIIACALVRPDKKLASVTPKFVMRKYKEKAFAASAKREEIETCSGIGFTLPEFAALNLAALQGISEDLGL